MDHEVEVLRAEVRAITELIKQDRLARFDEQIEHRTMPPLSQMTRVQRRFYLEPWFTFGWMSAWGVTVVLWLLACILPWHTELASAGVVFLLVGAGCGLAKMWHQEENTRLEGKLQARSANREGMH